MLRRPVNINPFRITVFLCGIYSTTRGCHAAELINDDGWRFPEMKRRELNLSISTHPCLDQVATVIVQAHGDQVPINHNFPVGHPAGANVPWWPIELSIG